MPYIAAKWAKDMRNPFGSDRGLKRLEGSTVDLTLVQETTWPRLA